MPNTTNFNWPTPADTDLVKDGAAAIRNLGNGIDTSLIDLKGGTTGQILSKASNADMDFTFITPNVGDITEVQAGTGISVASGTGPIPVVTNTVATAFDAAGDLVYGTGADTFTKLALGTANQVLTVNSGATAPEWKTPAGGGKVLQVVQDTTTTQESTGSTSFVDTALSLAITPSAASSKILCIVNANAQIQKGSDTYIEGEINLVRTSTEIAKVGSAAGQGSTNEAIFNRQNLTITYLDSPNTTSATTYKVQMRMVDSSADIYLSSSNYLSSLTLIEIGA